MEVPKADFHTAILTAELEGFSIQESAFVQLERILFTIGDKFELCRGGTRDKQQYWLMLTRYDWQAQIQTVQPGEWKSNPTRLPAQDTTTG